MEMNVNNVDKEIKFLEGKLLSLVAEVSQLKEKHSKEKEIMNNIVSKYTYNTIIIAQRAVIEEKIEAIEQLASKINSLIEKKFGFI